MKEELLKNIKKEYDDISQLVKTNFAELDQEFVTPGRLKEIERIRKQHSHWVTSEDIDIYDQILSEVINKNTKDDNIGKTNRILMFISELNYDTYTKLFSEEINIEEAQPEDTYILYMDIEDNSKYFVKKENQAEFEASNNVIVPFKTNPNISAGWNHDRNIQRVEEIRNEFIKNSLYAPQEEAASQLIKKYPND